MGEIADWMVDQELFGRDFNYGTARRRGQERKEREVKKVNRNQSSFTREVKNVFKLVAGSSGDYTIHVEQGVHKEVIISAFSRKAYMANGFYSQNKTVFNNSPEIKEVINMHHVFTALVNILNNLNSADLLTEHQYNSVLDGFEPFIYEAIEYEEFKAYLEETSLNSKKKKRISRRGRT